MQCWGWATWKSKWSCYSRYNDYFEILEKSELLLNRYRICIGRDSLDNLRNTMLRDKDLWACKWVLTHFMNDALCICPRFSLSKNIGLDGSGSNCGVGPIEEFQFQDLDLSQCLLTIKTEVDLETFKRFMSAHTQQDDVLIEYLAPYGVKIN